MQIINLLIFSTSVTADLVIYYFSEVTIYTYTSAYSKHVFLSEGLNWNDLR